MTSSAPRRKRVEERNNEARTLRLPPPLDLPPAIETAAMMETGAAALSCFLCSLLDLFDL